METKLKDTSPIDQRWIQKYCNELIKVASNMPDGLLKDAIFRRVEITMDLVEGWQKRNERK